MHKKTNEIKREPQTADFKEQILANCIDKGYYANDVSVSFMAMNIIGIFIAVPLVVVGYLIFVSTWPQDAKTFFIALPDFQIGMIPVRFMAELAIFIVAVFISIVLHEFLHGIVFNAFCKGKWKDNIKIGVMWDKLTPYCTCRKPVGAIAYLLACLTPFMVLGIGLFGMAMFLGKYDLMQLSLMNIFFSCGDILISFMLIAKHPKLALDDPKRCGFTAFYTDIKKIHTA